MLQENILERGLHSHVGKDKLKQLSVLPEGSDRMDSGSTRTTSARTPIVDLSEEDDIEDIDNLLDNEYDDIESIGEISDSGIVTRESAAAALGLTAASFSGQASASDLFPELTDPEETGTLTSALLVEYGDAEKIDEVTQLICRGKKIHTVELEEAVAVETASFSHNLITDCNQFTILPNIIELNLNFNKIQDISPLTELETLRILNLSHNYIRIVTPLKGLLLTKLSLFKNFVDDFPNLLDAVGEMPLKSLDIGSNPCTNLKGPKPKYQLINTLTQLEELDQNTVEDIDRELADQFLDKFAVKRPATAPPRTEISNKLGRSSSGGSSGSSYNLPTSLGATGDLSQAWVSNGEGGEGSRLGNAVPTSEIGRSSPFPLSSVSNSFLSQIPSLRSEIPKVDYDDPHGTIEKLLAHIEQITLRKQTIQVEKENLERQLAAELTKKQRRDDDTKILKAENKNLVVLMNENEELRKKVSELESRVGDPITCRRLEQKVERMTEYCKTFGNENENSMMFKEKPRPMTSCGVPVLSPGRELDDDLAALVRRNQETIEALKKEKAMFEEQARLENNPLPPTGTPPSLSTRRIPSKIRPCTIPEDDPEFSLTPVAPPRDEPRSISKDTILSSSSEMEPQRLPCPACERTFTSDSSLDVHMKRRHLNRVVIH